MNDVFLDTVGLLAQWNTSDQWHEDARAAAMELAARGMRTVSTWFVFLECGNAAARRPFRIFVDDTREEMERSGRLITPTEADWREAWAAYRTAGIGAAGIVDQISFIVMRRLGITEVFTNDRHFNTAGFTTLF